MSRVPQFCGGLLQRSSNRWLRRDTAVRCHQTEAQLSLFRAELLLPGHTNSSRLERQTVVCKQNLRDEFQVRHAVTIRSTRDFDGDLARRSRAHASLCGSLCRGPDGIKAVECGGRSNAAANVGRGTKGRPTHSYKCAIAAGGAACGEVGVEWVLCPAPEVAPRFEEHAGLWHRGADEEDGCSIRSKVGQG